MTVDLQPVGGFIRRYARALAVVVLFAAVGYLGFVRLDNAYFWDDEAYVGIIARNFLATGTLTGWDGRNLVTYQNGRMLDKNLTYINPPLDCIVAAASFLLFGQNTWAGRFPFVVAGLVSLAIFAVIVRRDFRDQPALWLYALGVLGFSVVFLLNIRQCRYYSIGLLFALLSYDAYRRCLGTRRVVWYLVFAGAVIALFYSSFLYCAAFVGALAVAHLVFRRRELSRKDFWKLGVAVILVALATLPYAVAHRIWYRPEFGQEQELWYHRKFVLVWWNLRDLDSLGLPWMVAVLLVIVLVFTWRKDKNTRGVLEFVCLSAAYAVFVAILSPQLVTVSGAREAFVRYLLPAVPGLAVSVAAVVHFVHRWYKPLGMALFLVTVTTTLPSTNPLEWKPSWLLPAYIKEVHQDYPTSYSEVVAFLREHARQDDRVFACPEYANYPLMFYLGDKIRLCGLLNSQTHLPMDKVEQLERTGAPLLFDRHYPDWIVTFGFQEELFNILKHFYRTHVQQDVEFVRMDYQPAAKLNVFWYATQRPELHLHRFGPIKDFNRRTQGVYIFKGKLEQTNLPQRSSQP